jgi:hypothetical protein
MNRTGMTYRLPVRIIPVTGTVCIPYVPVSYHTGISSTDDDELARECPGSRSDQKVDTTWDPSRRVLIWDDNLSIGVNLSCWLLCLMFIS